MLSNPFFHMEHMNSSVSINFQMEAQMWFLQGNINVEKFD